MLSFKINAGFFHQEIFISDIKVTIKFSALKKDAILKKQESLGVIKSVYPEKAKRRNVSCIPNGS